MAESKEEIDANEWMKSEFKVSDRWRKEGNERRARLKISYITIWISVGEKMKKTDR